MEAQSSCEYDVLEVREGGEPQGPLVGRFCGHERPASYLSSSNKLYFNFRSDYSVSHSGFRIRYKTGEERGGERRDLFYFVCLFVSLWWRVLNTERYYPVSVPPC